MKRYSIDLPIFVVSQLGWWQSIFLIYEQNTAGKFCQPLWGLPVCYPEFVLYTSIWASQFVSNKKLAAWLLLLPAGLGLIMEAWYSLLQLTDPTPFIMHSAQFYGLPLSYVNLGFFTLLLLWGWQLQRSGRLLK